MKPVARPATAKPASRRPSTSSVSRAPLSSARSSSQWSQDRLDKAARKEAAEASKLAVFKDAQECFKFLCDQNHIKTFASQAADSFHPHLSEQRFELDLALLTKDDLTSTLLEFLAGFRHFSEIRLKCSGDKSQLAKQSVEPAAQKKAEASNEKLPLAQQQLQSKRTSLRTRWMRALASCIKNSDSLELLELDNLDFDDWTPLIENLPRCSETLSKVYFRNCQLGDANLRGVVAALNNTCLHHFQAAHCHLGSAAADGIKRLLQRDRLRGEEYQWANSLREEPLFDMTNYGLLWVDISFNELGNAGLDTITKAISDDSPLLILDMRHNHISLHPSQDAVPLSALQPPQALEAADTKAEGEKVTSPKKKRLSLNERPAFVLGPVAPVKVLGLNRNQKLTEAQRQLDFQLAQQEASDRKQEQAVIRELFSAMRFNTTLQHVDLRENDIDTSVQENLDQLLQRNRRTQPHAQAAGIRLAASAPPPVLVALPVIPEPVKMSRSASSAALSRNQSSSSLIKSRSQQQLSRNLSSKDLAPVKPAPSAASDALNASAVQSAVSAGLAISDEQWHQQQQLAEHLLLYPPGHNVAVFGREHQDAPMQMSPESMNELISQIVSHLKQKGQEDIFPSGKQPAAKAAAKAAPATAAAATSKALDSKKPAVVSKPSSAVKPVSRARPMSAPVSKPVVSVPSVKSKAPAATKLVHQQVESSPPKKKSCHKPASASKKKQGQWLDAHDAAQLNVLIDSLSTAFHRLHSVMQHWEAGGQVSADELRSAMRDTFGAAASSSSSGLFASAAPLSTLTMANDDQEDRRAFEALQRDALALRAQQKVKQLAELSRSGVHAHAFSAMAQANDELPTVSALERGDFDAVQMDSEADLSDAGDQQSPISAALNAPAAAATAAAPNLMRVRSEDLVLDEDHGEFEPSDNEL